MLHLKVGSEAPVKFVSEISLRLPRKLFIVIIYETCFSDQSIQKNIEFNFEKSFNVNHHAL